MMTILGVYFYDIKAVSEFVMHDSSTKFDFSSHQKKICDGTQKFIVYHSISKVLNFICDKFCVVSFVFSECQPTTSE